MPIIQLLSFIAILSIPLASCGSSEYAKATVRDCVKSEYRKQLALHNSAASPLSLAGWPSSSAAALGCGALCDRERTPPCQGFKLIPESSNSGTVCELYLFDKCTHAPRMSGCTQTADIYVKKLPGVNQIGRLCPSDYGLGFRGSKYKLLSVRDWIEGYSRCHQIEAGLTKYADAMDWEETQHFHQIKVNAFSYKSFYLGGNLTTTKGWIWACCDLPINPNLWGFTQPNEGPEATAISIWHIHPNGLDDTKPVSSILHSLCECMDPFND